MPGATPLSILAAIAVPSAWQCLAVAGPFLAIGAVWWLINRTDQILNHLFPDWEWERKLGWLEHPRPAPGPGGVALARLLRLYRPGGRSLWNCLGRPGIARG